MTKPRIAVDIDGVLAENDGPVCAIINKVLGSDFSPSDLTSYYALDELVKPYFASDEEAHEFIAQIWWNDGFLTDLPIYLPAISGMRRLAGLARELTILTARNTVDNPTAKIQTRFWLDKHVSCRSNLGNFPIFR